MAFVTAYVHRRNTRNVGDLASSPGDYLDLGPHRFFDFQDDVPDCRLAVLGGGQVFRDCVRSVIAQTRRADRRVVWGVGISPKDAGSIEFDILQGHCALLSSRNWGLPKVDYVPCASALSPLFEAPPPPRHPVVLFTHATKSDGMVRVPGIPERSNRGGTMAEAIDFLASGETVVTNSYHGTYWAMCLGRRVLCVPFNRKFHFFRDAPVMAGPEDWPAAIARAERRVGVLDDARARNLRFRDKVLNLI